MRWQQAKRHGRLAIISLRKPRRMLLTSSVIASTLFSIFVLFQLFPSPPISDVKSQWTNSQQTNSAQDSRKRQMLWRSLQDDVRHVTRVMYSNYFDKCAYQDELNPHNMQCEGFLGMHATAVDSLDTLLLLNLHDEYNRTREYLRHHLKFEDVTEPISVFETTIRILGGLNSAYALTGDSLWRTKAVELAERFLPLFNESESGCPRNQAQIVNTSSTSPGRFPSKVGIGGSSTSTADVGTLQLEMRSVSLFTGDPRFAQAVDRCTESLLRAVDDLSAIHGGLPPPHFNVEASTFVGSEQTVSGLVDSFIEMLLKTWLASGKSKQDEPLIRLFHRITEHVWKNLVKTSPTGITFVTNKYSAKLPLNDDMHHLSCFYPGSLALAALHGLGGGVDHSLNAAASDLSVHNASHATLVSEQEDKADVYRGDEGYLQQARMLGRACREMSRAGEHGIAAEMTKFVNSGPTAKSGVDFSWLRPEVVEALFYLDSVDNSAGDRYKEWGRQMWQSMRKHSQVPGRPDGLLGSWKGLRNAKAYFEAENLELHRSEQNDDEEDEDDFGFHDDGTAVNGDDDDENDNIGIDGDNTDKHLTRDVVARAAVSVKGENASLPSGKEGVRKFLFRPDGKLHSFVIAETLKYFWLLFDDRTGDDAPLPLTKWVFNTEAHPVPIVNAFDRHTFPGSLYVPQRDK